MKRINKKILFNIIGFYICWWGSIFGAANDHFYIGPLFVLLFLFIHFYKIVYHKNEIAYLFICFCFGFIIDTIFLRMNIISYKGYLPDYFNIAPLWVVCLWVCFGATVYHSFSWVRRKYFTMSILGAMFGPLIYYSGAKLESLNFINNANSNIKIVAIAWAILIPLLVFISDRLIDVNE